MYIEEEMINPDEMAKRLEISPGNLRKWCLELEANGYSFKKDTRGKRSFNDSDQMVLMKIKYAIQEKKLTKEVAVKTVIEGINKNRSSPGTQHEHSPNEEDNRASNVPVVPQTTLTVETIETLAEHLRQQQEINNKLLGMVQEYEEALRKSEEQRRADHEHMMNQIKQLQAHIDERMNQRDKKLLEHIRSAQKQQQQQLLELAAAQEEREQKKRGLIARLFGR
jgi:hypothetical protein